MTAAANHALRSSSLALAACFALAACAGSAETQRSAASPEANARAYPAAPPAGEANTVSVAKEAAPATPPSDMTPSAAGAAAAPYAQAAPPAAPPAPSQASADGAADARDQPSTRKTTLRGTTELERAEREIASGDCATACRALGSMERAVVFLCKQADADSDANRCSDAKGRLVASRKRVRTSCGSCAGGPSVDPDAPVPSTR